MIRTALRAALRLGFWLAPALVAHPAWAQGEPAVTKRAVELREAPGESGRSLAALPAQARVMRLNERKGPWIQVRTEAGVKGWVHLFDVGPASAGAATSTSDSGSPVSGVLRGVSGVFTRGGSTTATTATGIRGLGAEDIANAQPNPAAVGQMEALRQGESQARDFAKSASIAAVAVEPLPAPPRPAGGSRSGDPANPEAQ